MAWQHMVQPGTSSPPVANRGPAVGTRPLCVWPSGPPGPPPIVATASVTHRLYRGPFCPPPERAKIARLVHAVTAIAVLVISGCPGLPERQLASRNQCRGNLAQIGSALQRYVSANGCFPPAVVSGDGGNRMASWRVAILPYLGRRDLFDAYDWKQSWDSPSNREVGRACIPTFRCPSAPGSAATAETNYVRIVGTGTVGGTPNEAVIPKEITGGASNTIVVVEVFGRGIGWEEPRDITPDEFMRLFESGEASPHPGGFNALFADGSARFVPSSADPAAVRSLLFRTGKKLEIVGVTVSLRRP